MTSEEQRLLLKQYLDNYLPDYGDEDANSALTMLYTYFRENNKFEDAEIKEGFHDLYSQLEMLSLKEIDKIIYIVCDLCIGYERTSFIEGVKLGYLLSLELVS